MSPTDDRQTGPYILWGIAHSLYSGKARSYLLKKGVPFREVYPANPRFRDHVIPRLGMMVVPVLETADGDLIQDTNDIIAHVEARHLEPVLVPEGPVQRAVAELIGAFGSEHLLATAMHYRWSYRAEQEGFLRAEFGRAGYVGADPAARDLVGAATMGYFAGFIPNLGVTPETIPVIEQACDDLFDALERHFQTQPYILGGRPSIADFGLIAPLFAHLGRDPVPASRMKLRAPNLYRWTERMNQAAIVDGEFDDHPPAYPPDDAIPETLEPVLSLVFRDWGPQLMADAQCYAAWCAADPDRPAGTLVAKDGKRRVHPSLGPITFDWRGVSYARGSAPYGLWRFDEAARFARGVSGDARRRLDALLARTGGEAVMAIRLARPMTRSNNALVLA